jgi:hypothetical protein
MLLQQAGFTMPASALSGRAWCGILALLLAMPAKATLPDEIQVYDDSINKKGAVGLELHVNATPSGDMVPEYPGEATTGHGLRTTMEWSYGFTDTLEGGLYLPVDRTADGNTGFAGPRMRLKWIFQKAPEQGGNFYGINFEFSDVKRQYEIEQNQLELRPIMGFRNAYWLFAFNPVLDFALHPGYREGGPEFSPQFKIARTVHEGYAVGIEYYADMGKLTSMDRFQEQEHVLYLALDVDRPPWVFNVGIGRGLTSDSDRWTIKTIFEVPFD